MAIINKNVTGGPLFADKGLIPNVDNFKDGTIKGLFLPWQKFQSMACPYPINTKTDSYNIGENNNPPDGLLDPLTLAFQGTDAEGLVSQYWPVIGTPIALPKVVRICLAGNTQNFLPEQADYYLFRNWITDLTEYFKITYTEIVYFYFDGMFNFDAAGQIGINAYSEAFTAIDRIMPNLATTAEPYYNFSPGRGSFENLNDYLIRLGYFEPFDYYNENFIIGDVINIVMQGKGSAYSHFVSEDGFPIAYAEVIDGADNTTQKSNFTDQFMPQYIDLYPKLNNMKSHYFSVTGAFSSNPPLTTTKAAQYMQGIFTALEEFGVVDEGDIDKDLDALRLKIIDIAEKRYKLIKVGED